MSDGALAKITAMVDTHPARHISWQNGKVPIGYYYLCALTYGRWYLKLKAVDPVALFIARAAGHDSGHDALPYYRGIFAHAGIDIDSAGVPALRALFTLVGGDGSPESSGNWSRGKDPGAANTSAESCEAGIWQTSHNARAGNPALFDALFGLAQRFPNSGFLEYAKEGMPAARPSDLLNYGSGIGVTFQRLTKVNPAFACATAALVFRCLRTHYGTLRDYKAHVEPVFYDLLKKVEAIVDGDPATFASALSEDPKTPIPIPAVKTAAPIPQAGSARAPVPAPASPAPPPLPRLAPRPAPASAGPNQKVIVLIAPDQAPPAAPAAVPDPPAFQFPPLPPLSQLPLPVIQLGDAVGQAIEVAIVATATARSPILGAILQAVIDDGRAAIMAQAEAAAAPGQGLPAAAAPAGAPGSDGGALPFPLPIPALETAVIAAFQNILARAGAPRT